MKQSLKYFFNFFFLFYLFVVHAQDADTKDTIGKQQNKAEIFTPKNVKKTDKKLEAVKKDSIPPKTDRYGLIVGVEINKLIRSFYDSNYKGIGFVGDYRLTKKYYLAGGFGNDNLTTDDAQLNFTTKGSYIKFGFDYNTYENWLDMENLITVGVRYGFSTFSQQLNSYEVYNSNPYFSKVPTTESGNMYKGLTSNWAEVVAGVNVKVFNNIYVGFSLQLHVLITNSEPEDFSNLYIPGFNRTYDGNFGAGFNYTVSYFIPIYKKKVIAKKIIPKKKQKD